MPAPIKIKNYTGAPPFKCLTHVPLLFSVQRSEVLCERMRSEPRPRQKSEKKSQVRIQRSASERTSERCVQTLFVNAAFRR